MESVSLLWKLQNLEEEMNEIKTGKKIQEIQKNLEELKSEYESIKVNIQNKVVEYKEWDHDIIKNDSKNKNLNYEIKELQEKIYDGSINNIKVFSKMENELEEYKKESDHIDNETIENMEKKESAEKEIRKMKKKMLKIQERYKNEKDNLASIQGDIQIQQKKLGTKIEKLQKSIDKSYLENYRMIQQNIQPVMVKIENGICSGCYMNQSLILLKEIQQNPQIYTCESCGRILYLEKKS